MVFDKVRENTKNLRASRTTYAKAANLAVNQTLVRSINTSIVALIPVGAILYVSAVQLGSSSLKDLALALFVGMAAGAYSSIFIATPLLVHLKSTESEIVLAERRAKARERRNADRYASVPVFKDDLPIVDPDGARWRCWSTTTTSTTTTTTTTTTPTRRGRLDARGDGPRPRRADAPSVRSRQSPASGRQQPTRQPRSKRGK